MASGRVVDFDQPRGLGAVVDEHSGQRHWFHCIEIADGSRTIDVDTPVTFELRRKLGRVEAASIRPR